MRQDTKKGSYRSWGPKQDFHPIQEQSLFSASHWAHTKKLWAQYICQCHQIQRHHREKASLVWELRALGIQLHGREEETPMLMSHLPWQCQAWYVSQSLALSCADHPMGLCRVQITEVQEVWSSLRRGLNPVGKWDMSQEMCECCHVAGWEMCRPLDQCSVEMGMNIHSGQLHVEFSTDIRGYGSGGLRKITVVWFNTPSRYLHICLTRLHKIQILIHTTKKHLYDLFLSSEIKLCIPFFTFARLIKFILRYLNR